MSPMRYFINAAINTDDIVVPLNIHHDHGYAKLSSQSACLLQLTMAVQSMWMTLRMSQSHCLHLQIILSATVRRKILKTVIRNMWLRMTAISLMMTQAVLTLMRNREHFVVYTQKN